MAHAGRICGATPSNLLRDRETHKMREEKTRVLLIEDNEDDAMLIQDILAEGAGRFTIKWISTYDGGLAAIEAGEFDVCLLDYRLGDKDGLELFRKAARGGVQSPVVFLTGMADEELDRQALSSGAADYVSKGDITPPLLRRVIRHSIERARVTNALSASEEKFRAVFENAAIGIALVDKEARLLDVNPCFTDIFNASGESLCGRTLDSLAHDDDCERLKAVLDRFMDGGPQCFHLESRYVSSGGEVVWARLLLSPLELNEDTGAVATAMILDITGAKRAEEEQARLALFPATNPNPVLRFNSAGDMEYANAAGIRLVEAWIGSGTETDSDKLRAIVNDVYKKGDSREIDVYQHDLVFALTLHPVEGENIVFCYGREITEARRAEEDLRRAALVFEHTVDGVMVTDREGVIRSVNSSFTRITGYESREVVGRKPNIVKSNHHPPEFYAEMWRALLVDGEWDGEVWNRRKNGEMYIASMSVRAVRNALGEVSQFVSVFSDVTEEQLHKQELRYQAYHDPLTGLPNRALFYERLGQAIVRARRSKNKLALLFIDLNGFKDINDSYGHHVGDLLLQGVATRIVISLREDDTVARLGGDEFTVILENLNGENAVETATNRIIAGMNEAFDLDGKPIRATLALGVAIHEDFEEDSATLIRRADSAMYRAKKRGVNNAIYDKAAN